MGDQGGGDLIAGAEKIRDRVAMLGEQFSDPVLEPGDALVEVLDVAGEFADAPGGDLLGQSVTKGDAAQPFERGRAVATKDLGLGDRADLGPVRTQPLDGLGAVVNEALALQLKYRQGADQFGLERRTELVTLVTDDVGDRRRVTGIGLPGPLAVALAVRAPSRNVEHLMAASGKRADSARP